MLKVVASQVMVRALQVVGRGPVREFLSGTETLSLGRLAANPIGMQWRKGGPKVGSTQNLMALAMVVIGGKGTGMEGNKAVALVARALEVVASQVVKAKEKVKEKEMGKEMVKALQAVAKALQAVQVMGIRALVARARTVVARGLNLGLMLGSNEIWRGP